MSNRFEVKKVNADQYEVIDTEFESHYDPQETVTVDSEHGANVLANAFEDSHIVRLGFDHGYSHDDMDDRYYLRNDYTCAYYEGYNETLSERVGYTKSLMEQYPESDPSGDDWLVNHRSSPDNVWNRFRDSESAIEHIIYEIVTWARRKKLPNAELLHEDIPGRLIDTLMINRTNLRTAITE